MSLDGLRAWIGEVERKLGMRTRVFLVLASIAIGAAGAGIYLALKASDDAVSKSEVTALHEEVASAAGGAAGGGEAAAVSRLEAEVQALRSQLEGLRSEGGGTPSPGAGGAKGPQPQGGGTSDGGSSGSGGASESGAGAAAGAKSGTAVPKTQGQLKEAIEKAEEEAKSK